MNQHQIIKTKKTGFITKFNYYFNLSINEVQKQNLNSLSRIYHIKTCRYYKESIIHLVNRKIKWKVSVFYLLLLSTNL